MKRKITAGGITFFASIGKVVAKEYMGNFGVSFNTGDLKGCDKIRWVITKDGESGATFDEVSLTEAYVDLTINMVDYFNARFTETGSYILHIQCLKGSTFAGGANLQFYFCKYANYQMGISFPNRVRSVFRPAVYSYDQSGLHVDSETAVAEFVEFECAGYAERVRVYNGIAKADMSEYLKTLFSEIKPWDFASVDSYYNFLSDNPLYRDYSVVIKLLDKNEKLIGAAENNIDCFFNVEHYFDKSDVENAMGTFRKRRIFWNYPFTFDLFHDEFSNDPDGYNFNVGFSFKKPVPDDDKEGTYSTGQMVSIKCPDMRSVQIDFKRFIQHINNTSTAKIDYDFALKYGLYIVSDNGLDSSLTASNKRGIDCEISGATCGLYFRWISRFGEHCYWLFSEGETVQEVKTASEFKRVDSNLQEQTMTNKETTKTVKVGDVVRSEYLGFLCSFADGWGQQLYDAKTGTWSDVEVLDAKVSVSKQAVGNRIEFEVSIPQTNVKF